MVTCFSQLKQIFQRAAIGLMTTAVLFSLSGCQTTSNDLTILAAASTKEALTEAAAAYEQQRPEVTIHLSFGGSGALAEQIAQGAKVDLFLSASAAAVEKVSQAKKAYDTSILLENQLVMVQPATSSFWLESEDQLDASQIRKIALGEPKSVPAGAYAQKILTDLKLYEALSEKYVYGKDVKEVLSWVASGEASAGFVYQTDALSEPKVRVVKTYTSEALGVIGYPLVRTNPSETQPIQAFVTWLKSEQGMAYFKKYGFQAVKPD